MVKINQKAIFLDRDGVLNFGILKNGKSYAPREFKQFRLYPKIKKYCDKKKKKGFKIIVITNQPDVGRGKIKKNEVLKMHKKLNDLISYDDLYCSYSKSKRSYLRKPNPGMLIRAAKKHKINLRKSFLIGDRWSDVKAAEAAKCNSIFIERFYREKTKVFNPTKKVRSLGSAISYIEKYN